MQWFSTSEICNILSRYDHIYLIGDSMLRHTAQAFNVLLREDLVDGGRATWRNDEEPLNCRCYNVFDNPGCVWMSAINTIDVLLGDRSSIRCSADKTPALITCKSPARSEMPMDLINCFRDTDAELPTHS